MFVVFCEPRHIGVVTALRALGVRRFATMTDGMAESIRAATPEAHLIRLESLLDDDENAAIDARAAERVFRVRSYARSHPIAVDERVLPLSPFDVDRVLAARLENDLSETEKVLSAFDRLNASVEIRGFVCSADFTRLTAAACQWMRSKVIPSFHVLHGIGLGPLFHSDRRVRADYVLAPGRAGALQYLDLGVSPDRVAITGSPSLDPYATLVRTQPQVRSNLRTMCGFPEEARVVVFATTCPNSSIALSEFQRGVQTLEAFGAAAAYLQDRGVDCRFIVKDRVQSGQSGRELVDRVMRAAGVKALYAAGRPEILACGADVVVASDSGISVEAMACGVPTVNVWSPATWLLGPYFASYHAVPHFRCDEPHQLGAEIGRLLSDADYREERIAAQREAFTDIALAADGNAGRRCAEFIVAHSAPAGP